MILLRRIVKLMYVFEEQLNIKSFVLATNIEGRVIFPACMLLLKVISVSVLKYWWTFTIFHWKSKRSGLWESCYKNLPCSKWHIMKDICNFKVLSMSCFVKCMVPLMYIAEILVFYCSMLPSFKNLKLDQTIFVPRIIFPWLAIVMGYNREFIVVSKGRSKMMLY